MLCKVAFENNALPIYFLCLNIGSYLFFSMNSSNIISSFWRFKFPSGGVGYVMIALQVLNTIFYYFALYKTYKRFSDKATVMILLTVLSFGLLHPIFLFSIRNNELKN